MIETAKAPDNLEDILERAKAHDVVAGIHDSGSESASRRIAKGFRLDTVSFDAQLLAARRPAGDGEDG